MVDHFDSIEVAVTTRPQTMVFLRTLPTELLIKILANTSARNVQLSRVLCKYVRDIIDENEGVIGHRIHAREHARLTSWIDYHFHFDVDKVSFVESLRRWFARTGLSSEQVRHLHGSDSHEPFATRATERLQQVHGHVDSSQDHGDICMSLKTMVEFMMLLYFHHRSGISSNAPCFPHKETLLTYPQHWKALQPLQDLGILDLVEYWHATIDIENSIIPPEDASMTELRQRSRSFLPITAIDTFTFFDFGPSLSEDEAGYHEFRHASQNPLCSPEELSRLLGAPPLPMGDGKVAYCVRNQRAYRLVQRALVEELGPLQRLRSWRNLSCVSLVQMIPLASTHVLSCFDLCVQCVARAQLTSERPSAWYNTYHCNERNSIVVRFSTSQGQQRKLPASLSRHGRA